MIKYISAFFILVMMNTAVAQKSIAGVYLTEDGSTHVEVFEKEDMLFGTIKHSANPKVPVGNMILTDFVRDGVKWKGKIHAKAKGKILDASLHELDDGLKISIYYGWKKKTLIWSRVDPDASSVGDGLLDEKQKQP